MSNCLNHKRDLFGETDMKKIAEMIGDLNYESLADLFDELAYKLYQDSLRDAKAEKLKLSEHLDKASNAITVAHIHIKTAWKISEPFMKP